MSAGGHISAMLSSLKNNARKRRTIYDQDDVYNKKGKKKRVIQTNNNASPEELKQLRSKLELSRKKRYVKLLIYLGIIILVSFLFVLISYQI